nr:PREDICTED: uncharacterized protein LOC109036385 [Bemisia tabaci]
MSDLKDDKSSNYEPESRKKAEFSDWLSALQRYVKDTQVTFLDLSDRDLTGDQCEKVLEIVATSAVTKLNLGGNSLHSKALQLLKTTELQELDLKGCSMAADCFIQLLTILKDTRITCLHSINGCNADANAIFKMSPNDVEKLKDSLAKCCLETLSINRISSIPQLIQALPLNLITNLHAENISEEQWPSFFHSLNRSIKSLSLRNFPIRDYNMRLFNSKLEILAAETLESLKMHSNTSITTVFLDELKHSKIAHLEINLNCMPGSHLSYSHLESCLKSGAIKFLSLASMICDLSRDEWACFTGNLKESSVETLLLKFCKLQDEQGEQLMDGLKGSKVSKLDLSSNLLQTRTAEAFSRTLKDTNLTEVNFLGNRLPIKALEIIGNSIVPSKLKSIKIYVAAEPGEERIGYIGDCFSHFLENTRNSQLTSVGVSSNCMEPLSVKKFSRSLANSTITHLNLASNCLEDAAMYLKDNLVLSAITHLNLSDTSLNDDGVEILTQCLGNTKIIDLDLSANLVTNRGAVALARCLKSTKLISLNVEFNRIGLGGLKFLASHAENTFITTFKADSLGNEWIWPIDKVVWGNRILVHRLVSFFKLIRPENCAETFNFDRAIIDDDIPKFLEECFKFYKTVIDQPSAISVISQEENLSHGKNECVALLMEDFPRQFAEFVSSRIEADVAEHVAILARADELALNKIVEHLLLCRPIYIIDEENEILHPVVYRLLLKYKMPLCNLDVEPDGLKKILKFFTDNPELEGALETVNLLSIIK